MNAETAPSPTQPPYAPRIDHVVRNPAVPNPAVQAASTISPNFRSQLDRVWRANLPLVRERLDTLEVYAAQSAPTAQQHDAALTIAHNFAGSLGIFGYPAASQLARSLEHLLESTPIPGILRMQELTSAIRAVLVL